MTLAQLKISTNLFLGAVELSRLTLWWEQNNAIINSGVAEYGIVRGYGVGESSGMRIIAGGTPSKITIGAGTALAYDSTDEEMRLIHIPSAVVDVADVPTDSTDYYVKLVHLKSNLEEGTCAVSASGQLTGSGTLFESILRGQPSFPSKIAFEKTGLVNTGEYEVVTITDDVTAQLSGTFTLETGLKYKTVGTFTPDVVVASGDKYIFEYNSYEIVVEASSTVNNTDEFLLAKVNSDGVTLVIEDYRTQWAKTLAEDELTEFDDSANAVVGVEWAKYDTVYSARDANLVKLGWGYRAANGDWSANLDLQRITIATGEGGIFDTGDAVTSGIMDGWRVYFGNSGKYVRVVTQTYSTGNVILNLDRYSTPEFPASGTGAIVVVPDCDKIAIRTVSRAGTVDHTVEDDKSFPVHYGEGIMRIKATGAKIQYRQVWGRNTGIWRDINDGDYIDESSWDDDGTLNVAALSSVTGAEITLLLNPNSYATNGMKKNIHNVMVTGGSIQNFYGTTTESGGVISLPVSGVTNAFAMTSASTTLTGMASMGVGTMVVIKFTNSQLLQDGGGFDLSMYALAGVTVQAGQVGVFIQTAVSSTVWTLVSISGLGNTASPDFGLNVKSATSDKLFFGMLNDSNSTKNFSLFADGSLSAGSTLRFPQGSGMIARYDNLGTTATEAWTSHTPSAGDIGVTAGSVSSLGGASVIKMKVIGKTLFIRVFLSIVQAGAATSSYTISNITPLAGLAATASPPNINLGQYTDSGATNGLLRVTSILSGFNLLCIPASGATMATGTNSIGFTGVFELA